MTASVPVDADAAPPKVPCRTGSSLPPTAPIEEENIFADIAQLFIQVQAVENEYRRETSVARKGKRFTPPRAKPPVEAPLAREQPALTAAQNRPAEILAGRAEQDQNATLMVREFLSPAQTVFRVREDDWIEATMHGLIDVRLCDAQGHHIEQDTGQSSVKTTLRVSSALKYAQSLVPLAPLTAGVPKRTGRRR